MSQTTVTPAAQRRRERKFGVFSLVMLAIMLGVFASTSRGTQATFVLNDARGQLFSLPDLVLPVMATVVLLSAAVAAIAARQFTHGFGSRAVVIVGVVALLFVIAFLTWAAAGGQLSLVGLLRGSLARATPIALGAMAGVLCERAGVINIAIEGQFLLAWSGLRLLARLRWRFWPPAERWACSI